MFAGCLFPQGQGAASLAHGSERLHIVPLDVTNERQVKEAVHYVKTNLKGNRKWSEVNALVFNGSKRFSEDENHTVSVIQEYSRDR